MSLSSAWASYLVSTEVLRLLLIEPPAAERRELTADGLSIPPASYTFPSPSGAIEILGLCCSRSRSSPSLLFSAAAAPTSALYEVLATDFFRTL